MVDVMGDNDDPRDDDVAPPATSDAETEDAGSPPDQSDSSTDTDDDDAGEPKTLEEAIEGAIKAMDEDGEEPPPAPETPAGPEVKEPEAAPVDGADDDPSEAELKAMRPNARKGIVRLLSQRNAARRERDDVTARLEHETRDAGEWRNIQSFMTANRMPPTQMREFFELGRKLNSQDPRLINEATDTLVNLAARLLDITGRTTPQDLQEQVDNGELSEEAARRQAQDRARAALAEQRASTLTQDQQAMARQQWAGSFANGIKSAVAVWEAKVSKTDPDWALKAEAMQDAAHGVMAQYGMPTTPDQAVQLAQLAYDKVNARYKAFRPAPKATRRAPGPGHNGNRAGVTPASTGDFATDLTSFIHSLEALRTAQH